MKSWIIEDSSLKLVTMPLPEVKDDHVLLKVKAIGINRADLLQVRGLYPPTDSYSSDYYNVPGLEISGILPSGERCCALLPGGGYSEYVAVNKYHIIEIPDSMKFEEAAAIPEGLVTSWLNLYKLGGLAVKNSKKKVLINGGTSGMGTFFIQFALFSECKVFTTAKDRIRLSYWEGHKDCIILSYEEDYDEIIKKEGGVDLIVDILGGQYFAKNISALNRYGKIVMIAAMSGKEATINLGSILMKNASIIGSTLRSKSDIEKTNFIKDAKAELFPAIVDGRVNVVIDKVFSFDEIREAHAHMSSREHFGKIVVQL